MIPGQTPQGTPVTISVRPETLLLGPTIPAGLEPFSGDRRADHVPGRAAPDPGTRPGRLADRRLGDPEPVAECAGRPEPHAIGRARARGRPAGEVRGRQAGLTTDRAADRSDAACSVTQDDDALRSAVARQPHSWPFDKRERAPALQRSPQTRITTFPKCAPLSRYLSACGAWSKSKTRSMTGCIWLIAMARFIASNMAREPTKMP